MFHKSVKCVCIASGDLIRFQQCNLSLESAQKFWNSVQKVKKPFEILLYTEVYQHLATVCQRIDL